MARPRHPRAAATTPRRPATTASILINSAGAILGLPGHIFEYLFDIFETHSSAALLARTTVTWEDLRWIHGIWPGPMIIKGALTGDDARRAIDEGAAAVVVSNHGGRQLDCVPATLQALPEVVTAVNGRAEVLMDGGIRRGSDIIKAICLGAHAVLVGRAYAYGLATAGEPGVARALEILRADLDRTLKLLGCTSIHALDRSYVDGSANRRAG